MKRLKSILPEVILPNQTAFVQGRLLIENTILASEIVQGYHKIGGPKRITLKVDIAKAFDTIRWEFIFQCLRSLAVPEIFLRWLHACVCTTSYSLGFNGATYGFFKGSRGLRQGDPLSPYLFVLAMNCLSLSLNKAAREGQFGYHSKCQRTSLTHLCFADDLLIFCDGEPESVTAILNILKDFELRSGLAISVEKTSLFTAGIKPHELVQIKAATGLSEGTLPVRYLGVPLCTKKLSLTHCAPLLQSIKSKLHSWTVRTLSFAGRLQLLSTVIAGIVNFWSCAYILPKACTDEIDSLSSKFLWKGKTDGPNAAKVGWESVTKPKAEGGLGLCNLTQWNIAAALKLIWILFFRQDSIWSSWFVTEVLCGNENNFWVINTKQKHTWMTNKLISLRDIAYPWIKALLGNGERTYFWSSNWSPFGRIKDFLRGEASASLGIHQDSTLAELWELDHWVLPAARSENQVKIFSHLTSLSITNQPDQLLWSPNNLPSEKYSTQLIYNLIRTAAPAVPWHKEVWFSGGIPKHKFLTWLMTLNRCPTKDRMLQWGIQIDGGCVLCQTQIESRNHLFFHCRYSWDVWSSLASRCSVSPSPDWDVTLTTLHNYRGTRPWRKLLLLSWQAAIYLLWSERNQRLHRNRFRSSDSLLLEIDKQIRLRIASFRLSNPAESSQLLQLWFSSV